MNKKPRGIDMETAERAAMKSLRIAAGLSQKQLAHKLGYSHAAICRWEGGTANPSWFAYKAWRQSLQEAVNGTR